MTFRPRSAAWLVALAAAAAAFALAPSTLEAASAVTCSPGHGKKGALVTVVRRARCRPHHVRAAAESSDTPAPPCAPTLFAPSVFATNEGTTAQPTALAATGRLSAVMLFVDFADRPATEATERVYARLVPRARSWFSEASYGRAELDVTPLHGWLRLPRPSREYGLSGDLTFEEQREYIADAVAAADRAFDFSASQIVYVVAAGGSGLERSTAFHAGAGDGLKTDGTELRFGATFGDDIRTPDVDYPANVLVHESGHVFGLPDLYDTIAPAYPSLLRYAGGWDPMSWTGNGTHLLAWHKWKLGWLDPAELTCLHGPGALTTTLAPLARRGGLKAVVVPTGFSSALVIEARARLGHDRGLCEQGVLVYAVDAAIATGQGPVRVRPAQRDRSGERVHRCGLLNEAPFDRAPGETARFVDGSTGVTMEVLSSSPAGYRVRVTR